MKQVVFNTVSGSPDTDEWHSWRMGGIGGSDAPIIAAEAGLLQNKPAWMKSVNHLFLVKTGQKEIEDLSGNPAVRRGKENETPARQLFEEKTGILLSPCFGEMETHPFVRASFDGLSFEQDILAEIKVPSLKVHEMAKFGSVVDYYRPQIAHQAMVAWGHPQGWKDQTTYFISYLPEENELIYVEKPAKDYRAMAEKLLDAEIAFWNSVTNKIPPCGKEWVDAAAKYIEINDMIELLETEAGLVKDRLIQLLGNGESMEGGGVLVKRSIRTGAVDYTAAMKSLMPEKTDDEIEAFLNGFRKESTETVTLKIQRNSKKKEKQKRELV
jgi:putative phage-type endonuclease